jgi:uncharacterized protein YdhG (YjbR/CyaY superfamily)
MPKTKSRSHSAKAPNAKPQVDAYIAERDPAVRARLRAMRSAIRSVAPRAIEHFSYGIPGFRLDGQSLVWYAAFKAHTSLFPMTANIRKKHAVALDGYEMSTGTVRFPLSKPLPITLLKRLVKERVAEVRSIRPPK